MPEASSDRNTQEVLSHLKQLNARFIHNFVTNDVVSHDDLLHPAFLCINAQGKRVNRVDYLRRWANGFDPRVIPYWDVRDELITVIGDLALVRSTNKHTIRQNGVETTGMTAYTDTYWFTQGHWKCVQAQLTAVARENEPGDETIVSVYIDGVKKALRG